MRAYLATTPVERILICSLSAIFDPAYGVRELLELKDDPRVVPIHWVNPYLAEWQDDLARLSEELRVPGIKLHPTANIYDIETPLLRPVFEHCRRHRRFLCVHTDTFRSSPAKLTELVLDFPDVDVVLIHMDDPINSIFLAKRCPNVYLETSWVERKWANLAPIKIALDSVERHKLLFGTDFPYEFPLPEHRDRIGSPRTYEDIAEFYTELLPAEVAQDILYGNAQRFLSRYGL